MAKPLSDHELSELQRDLALMSKDADKSSRRNSWSSGPGRMRQTLRTMDQLLAPRVTSIADQASFVLERLVMGDDASVSSCEDDSQGDQADDPMELRLDLETPFDSLLSSKQALSVPIQPRPALLDAQTSCSSILSQSSRTLLDSLEKAAALDHPTLNAQTSCGDLLSHNEAIGATHHNVPRAQTQSTRDEPSALINFSSPGSPITPGDIDLVPARRPARRYSADISEADRNLIMQGAVTIAERRAWGEALSSAAAAAEKDKELIAFYANETKTLRERAHALSAQVLTLQQEKDHLTHERDELKAQVEFAQLQTRRRGSCGDATMEALRAYVCAVVPATLGASEEAVRAGWLANVDADAGEVDDDSDRAVETFVTEPGQQVLYVERQADGSVRFSSEVGFGGLGCAGAVLVKRQPFALAPIKNNNNNDDDDDDDNNNDNGKGETASRGGPDGQQEDRGSDNFRMCDKVRYAVLNMAQSSAATPATPSTDPNAAAGEDSSSTVDDVVGGVYDYIHFGLGPLLRSYGTVMTSAPSRAAGSAEDEGGEASGSSPMPSMPPMSEAMRQALPLISKRMNELEYAMRSCLQSMEIPEVRLAVDPVVSEALARAGGSADGKPLEEIGLGEDARDVKMLNRLQAGVNRWVKEIQKVTKLDRDAGTGSVSQEVQFWRNLERALQQIQRQVDGPEVRLTLDILKQSRRALATILFENDTGLQSAMKRVNNYMILMQDFPIGGLLAATDIGQIQEAIVQIFTHLKKIKSADEYPLSQAMRLVESLSRDMNDQILAVLASRDLMQMPYAEFDGIARSCQALFRTWDDNVRTFRELARDLAKRRGAERLPPKLTFEHAHLQERIEDLRSFRAAHEKLHTVLEKVDLSSTEDAAAAEKSAAASREIAASPRSQASAVDDGHQEEQKSERPDSIAAAYEVVAAVNVLDLSREGAAAWENAKGLYERRVDRLERRIIEHLTDRLGAAKTADEMFRVFSRFNALFFRPRIRGAIQQFQTRLIGTVEADIEALQRTFKRSYGQSQASLMSRVKDVPPVSGAIIWARQIERQLDQLLARVEAVLGVGWEQHVEGRRLKETGAAFKKKLNTQTMFDQWMKNIQNAPSFEVSGRLFRVDEATSGGSPSLSVNFDPEIVELFKEVRNLQWLGFRIPYTLKVIADEAKEKYPFAMSLQASLDAYKLTVAQMDDELAALLSTHVSEAQAIIEAAFDKSSKAVNWDSDGLRDYASDFAQRVQALQDKVVNASEKTFAVQEQLVLLKTCDYNAESLGACVDAVQRTVDDMNLASYTNLEAWVARLEERIDAVLQERLSTALHDWLAEFAAGKAASTWHEIVLRKHALYLDPPLQDARYTCIAALHGNVDVVANLPRIQSARYDTDNAVATTRRTTLLRSLIDPSSSAPGTNAEARALLADAYAHIEKRMKEVDAYASTWLQYQALWEMESSQVFEIMGESFAKWHRLLKDVQAARSTFDTTEHMQRFGPITIDFQQVQAQISLRYDAWHKELLGRFGTLLADAMKAFYENVSNMRNELEAGSFDAPTADVVTFITVLRKVQAQRKSLANDLASFVDAERLAQRQRMQFPASWIWSANLQGEWDALEQILARKERVLETELPTLQTKIVAEDRAVAGRIEQLASDWAEQRPVGGEARPAAALEVLALFAARKARVKDEWERVSLAKEAIQGGTEDALETGASPSQSQPQSHRILDTLGNEIESLQEVWTSLAQVAENLAQLRELPWTAVVPKKLRVSLDAILEELRKLPSRVRQYEAFEYIQDTVREYKKTQPLIIELRSEALKDRHWRQIHRTLDLGPVSELTLGDLWAKDLKRHQKPLQEIFRTAQGEMALEEFLRQIREFWTTYELDLVNFQNRCRIIRGWDELFTQLDEHTNSLASMKQSPYFKVFEEDASAWEDKLLRIRVVLDIWIDVQRRWVYLGAILFGSADIKQQLPNEYSRFSSIDGEFVSLMRKVSRAPRVLEVVNSMPNLDHSLGRLADLLEKIQRALGDYLERQRQGFSRFYFVGDEDLLEIIGNSKDPVKVQRHMSKMFAGIVSLKLGSAAEGGDQGDSGGAASDITAMVSREGEVVPFAPAPVPVTGKVNEWLGGVESAMRSTLSTLLQRANESNPLLGGGAGGAQSGEDAFTPWVDRFPSQILLLASQVSWCTQVDAILAGTSSSGGANTEQQLTTLCDRTEHWLGVLAERVLSGNISTEVRKKHEQIITEMVHQRDVLRKLAAQSAEGQAPSPDTFAWLSQIRYRWAQDKLSLHIASATFDYGFEYQGVGERLVQTPLTDRCYLALTQALHFRLGGNPFGPAGTGKTESVKALGAQMGRFVLVFNCDEHFDLKAMGRIFVGLCQVGAWGCFDEFNRLEERILSAVSQQILDIQRGLLEHKAEVSLLDRPVTLNPNVGIFVTMNPGYAGRSNLPDNLKQLFRAIAMIEPDRDLIAQVMLFSQGFKTAERLAGKVVLLFKLCADQLSQQPHYDFGLRAVKSVLLSAGNLKRASQSEEEAILIRSLCDNVVPKLVSEDVALFQTLLAGVFPGADVSPAEARELRAAIRRVCDAWCLEPSERWVNKVLQLDQVQQMRHGIMMVGPSGVGKSSSWRVLLEALELVDGQKGQAHVIDPKAISKEALYGTLDSNTLEWTNGIFTHTLRTILNNVRGEKSKRHWIVFDGDVDPEWAENLNSVLDDNKLLTLPNGERLSIPDNVRIMFEVETLKYATLATVSRCGMVWYSDDTLPVDDIFASRIRLLASGRTKADAAANWPSMASLGPAQTTDAKDMAASAARPEEDPAFDDVSETLIEARCAEMVRPLLASGSLVQEALSIAMKQPHVMDVTQMRLIVSFFSLMGRGFSAVNEYNQNRPDFPMEEAHMQAFLSRWTLFSVLWGFGSSMDFEARKQLAAAVGARTTVDLPTSDPGELWAFEVNVEDGGWRAWQDSVPKMEIDPHRVMDTDLVIPTVDTVRHAQVLHAWLDEHRPLILCGPPGSGKTMSLTSVLQSMPNFELASLNFSSATTPELILKTFEQYCIYKATRTGVVLAPPQPDRWLVVFCDEVNLPVADAYGTQHVITFMRQIVEQGGFWRPRDLAWVSVERIQFVSACNPPTDPGRVPLSHRFLRHTPLLLVDYPVADSLRQIYGTFNRALLKLQPSLRAHGDALTEAMVDVYAANKARFSADIAPHYVYSPRELSRWMRALYEALGQMETASVDLLVRLWLHEGLRLFHDRLVTDEERAWCADNLDSVARARFPGADHAEALRRPVLFANWISKNYVSVDPVELREHVEARLRVFYEEELNVPLVVFDDVLEHVLRIDRVLRQPLGHLLLVGKSGAGKTVLSRFVAWMNGLRVFQIKLSRKYSLDDFDEDLRYIMKQAGCQGEKVCFIFDESNVLESAFLERMNALLASGEVPGLFEGDEYNALMSACREAIQRDGTSGAVIDTDDDEEVFKAFTRAVQRNLHVVFTMNPASSDLKNRAATSPALFNRCVVDWFGDWSGQALAQVAHEFTRTLDLEASAQDYSPPSIEASDEIEAKLAGAGRSNGDEPLRYRHAVVATLVLMHESVQAVSQAQAARHENRTFVSPRDYLDLIKHCVDLYNQKREHLEEQQLHLNIGLDKLRETANQVEELGQSLSVKEAELEAKNKEANAKLQQMVSDQNEAEKKKTDAERMGVELDERNAKVDEQRATAEAELSQAKPALLDAEKAVSDIRRAHLDEMRSLNNPPAAVKLTLEAVCVMLGLSFTSWADIRRILQRREFIPDVVNFQSEDLTEDRRAKVQKMLENPDFVEEKVLHANKACVALFKWIVSQLDYAGILLRIQPLREEIDELAKESETLRERQAEEMDKVEELEKQIAQLKEEYAVLIAETETIKSEMNSVKSKVERSTALLDSLSQENERWTEARVGFADQMATLVGDVLLSAAFISYGGFFGFQQRQTFFADWRALLSRFGISFRKGLSLVEYMSRPAERLAWHAQGLPKDNLCEENAVILQHYNRFPLVVDPSGQASDFLMKHLEDRKVVKTSFLDASFMKQLESALRFGTCLVITDVENIDPVLNPVLNREIHRTGGRMLVRLGDQDIDFSPSFSMYLTTRDPTFQFAPDVCSRVTFVNFTVTPASLEALCLGKVLRAERPDVEQQREDLLKLQGEFQARLRELEDRLLDSINEAKVNILDDDSIIRTLESLKQEAREIQQKAAEADQVLETVAATSTFYSKFAVLCSRAYFALGRMVDVHFTYHFSLAFFFEILDGLLGHEPQDSDAKSSSLSHETRLERLHDRFLAELFRRVKQSLLERDELLFAVMLAAIADPALGARISAALASDAAADLVAARSLLEDTLPASVRGEADVAALAQTLKTRPELAEHIRGNAQAWAEMAQAEVPEKKVPDAWAEDPVDRMLGLRIFRPDRVFAGLRGVVDASFGTSFLDAQRTMLDLSQAILSEAKAGTPVLLLSTRGFDMSGSVDRLATTAGVRCRSVALGSAEGFRDADAAIAAGAQEGGWVMLKNVHLASEWLMALEKRIFGMRARADFRLILTSELNEKLPKTLLRQSNKLMFEAPKGVKASLLRSLQAMPAERVERGPKERARLYFALAWFHAVLLERLRFAPIGWTKLYEFSDADQACAMDVIDEWVDRVAQGREHVAPEELPWTAIRDILAESTYGGRIDNEFDQQILDGILESLFVPQIFETDFALVKGGDLHPPEGASKARFESWVGELLSDNDPSWLGLARTAENILLKNESARFQRVYLRLEAGEHVSAVAGLSAASDANDNNERSHNDEEADQDSSVRLSTVGVEDGTAAHAKPAWMTLAAQQVQIWSEKAAKAATLEDLCASTLSRTDDLVSNPIFRCWEREARTAMATLRDIRAKSAGMLAVLRGEQRMTNDLEVLSTHIQQKTVPADWQAVMPAASLDAWVQDFFVRLEAFEKVLSLGGDAAFRLPLQIDVGLLFSPGAFLTATRQQVAKALGLSLEELWLHASLGEGEGASSAGFSSQVILEGGGEAARAAAASTNASAESPSSSRTAVSCTFTWRHGTAPNASTHVRLPLYANASRAHLLSDVHVEADLGQDVILRGVALIAHPTF
ncbi:Dynein heavy chain, cytoplasmic [Hondaea fermentalgiana]|uniref:Dynein heavy chain, cytoplasmic n=1 Tax=Hondaea fermentalgiana TaxID=2315210 RepID=A0A2R5GS70_9STRA|nr:Dynein heavy chain, cytoplasmic [Hondaea fermentalgiana]|eukprot:GBG31493.1 Dynein heavy chain, cytoplasmic [Hondaea fermentalgiana]